MKAVLCSMNSKYIHSSLGVWYLAAAAEAFCRCRHEVEVVEGTINQPDSQVLGLIVKNQPEVVAFSCYIWNIEMVKRLARAVAECLPGVKIVLGGPEVSFNQQDVLGELPPGSFVLSGEGELSFSTLLDCLAGGSPADGVAGLAFRRPDGQLVCNKPPEALAEPPSPYTKRYFDSLAGRIAYLETSRGCPFSCSFCLSGSCRGVRFFSLERAKRELLALAQSGTKTVKLVDRTFNCNPDRAYAIFAFLIGQSKKQIPAGVCFHFEVGADLFDEKTLALLETAPPGLFQFEAGLQSFDPQTLEAVSRKTDIQKLCSNLKRLIRGGNIHLHIDLIAALPHETFAGFARSFNRAYSLKPHMLQLGFLKLLHGSKIRGQAGEFEYDYMKTPPYEVTKSRWLSEQEAALLHKTEDALERLHNSGRFRVTLAYLHHALACTPFELFSGFAVYAESRREIRGISLDEYSALVFDYFSAQGGVDALRLRDAMVVDRLCTDNTARMPRCLRVADKRLKTVAYRAGRVIQKQNREARTGAAILYGKAERAVIADYCAKHPVSGRYPLFCFSLPQIVEGAD